MPTIKLTGFTGIIPKTAKRMLPDNAAQVSNNTKIVSQELEPYKGAWPVTSQPTGTPAFKAMYLAVDLSTGTRQESWLAFNTEADVVRMPFSVETSARFAWTGDGIPKMALYSALTTIYALGVPNPTTKPTATPTGGTGATVSRAYCYTFYNPATGEESGPSTISDLATGKVDATWAITGMDVIPLNTGSITGALKDTPSVGKVRVTTSAAHWLRTGDSIAIAGVTGMTDLNGTYAVTVTSATQFYVTQATTQTYTAGGSWTRNVAWNTSGMTRRIYRTEGSAASFQLVAESSGTSYNDTILAANIPGDDLISSGWEPPPVDLKSLKITPSGSLVGVSGTQICFSEPFQPHAWPTAFRFGCDFPLVGVGVAGTDVVGITSANPYLVTGTEPSSMYAQKLSGIFPGLSKRSIVSDGNACYYATKAGIAAVQGGRVEIVTNSWFQQDEWQGYNPDTMYAAYTYERMFVGYVDGSGNQRILVFNFPYSQLTTLGLRADAMYVDETTGKMYVSDSRGVCEFDSVSAAPLLMTHRSKEFVLPQPCNFGAAKIVFDTGISEQAADAIAAERLAATTANQTLITNSKLHGGYNWLGYNTQPYNGSNAETVPEFPAYSTVGFTLYDADEVMFSTVVDSTGAFRLPAGFMMDRPNVQITAQGHVAYIILAETMDALRNA